MNSISVASVWNVEACFFEVLFKLEIIEADEISREVGISSLVLLLYIFRENCSLYILNFCEPWINTFYVYSWELRVPRILFHKRICCVQSVSAKFSYIYFIRTKTNLKQNFLEMSCCVIMKGLQVNFNVRVCYRNAFLWRAICLVNKLNFFVRWKS